MWNIWLSFLLCVKLAGQAVMWCRPNTPALVSAGPASPGPVNTTSANWTPAPLPWTQLQPAPTTAAELHIASAAWSASVAVCQGSAATLNACATLAASVPPSMAANAASLADTAAALLRAAVQTAKEGSLSSPAPAPEEGPQMPTYEALYQEYLQQQQQQQLEQQQKGKAVGNKKARVE